MLKVVRIDHVLKDSFASFVSDTRYQSLQPVSIMKVSLIALFVVLFIATVYAAKKKSNEDKEAEKAAKDAEKSSKRLSDLMGKIAASPVVSLTDSSFNKFVVERPRDYHALLMFTATAKQYQCSVCLRAKNVLDEVAKYYQDQYDFNTSSASQRIAFFKIEVDDARTTFGEMQLETVPRVYLLPPTNTSSPKMKVSDFEVEAGALLQGASTALEVITETTGIKVRCCCFCDLTEEAMPSRSVSQVVLSLCS